MAFSDRPTRADIRRGELFDLLEVRHPESKGELGELSDLVGETYNEGQDRAVILHGKQILAAIEGRGFADTAGTPTYDADSRLVPALERLLDLS
jgi:hypothetical protein